MIARWPEAEPVPAIHYVSTARNVMQVDPVLTPRADGHLSGLPSALHALACLPLRATPFQAG